MKKKTAADLTANDNWGPCCPDCPQWGHATKACRVCFGSAKEPTYRVRRLVVGRTTVNETVTEGLLLSAAELKVKTELAKASGTAGFEECSNMHYLITRDGTMYRWYIEAEEFRKEALS